MMRKTTNPDGTITIEATPNSKIGRDIFEILRSHNELSTLKQADPIAIVLQKSSGVRNIMFVDMIPRVTMMEYINADAVYLNFEVHVMDRKLLDPTKGIHALTLRED